MTAPRPKCVACGKPYGSRRTTSNKVTWPVGESMPAYRGNGIVVKTTMWPVSANRATVRAVTPLSVNPEIRAKYNFGAGVTSEWTPGARLELGAPNAGGLLGEGEVLEVDPPRRLVHTMVALWGDDVKAEGTSRVTWDIEPVGDSCRLTVTHDQLREGANDQLYGGWPMILSGLKTWLETGELLTTPGSLMWVG